MSTADKRVTPSVAKALRPARKRCGSRAAFIDWLAQIPQNVQPSICLYRLCKADIPDTGQHNEHIKKIAASRSKYGPGAAGRALSGGALRRGHAEGAAEASGRRRRRKARAPGSKGRLGRPARRRRRHRSPGRRTGGPGGGVREW